MMNTTESSLKLREEARAWLEAEAVPGRFYGDWIDHRNSGPDIIRRLLAEIDRLASQRSTVWAVCYGNYVPREVSALYDNKAAAQAHMVEGGGDLELVEWLPESAYVDEAT